MRSPSLFRTVVRAVAPVAAVAAVPIAAQAPAEADRSSMPGAAADPSFPYDWPFHVGDESEYDVTFGPIQVGRAHLKVEANDTIRGTPAYRLVMELAGGVPLYRLDDRTVSWLAVEPYRSLRFEQVLNQGGYHRHRRWEMDHDALTTTREDWDEEAESYRPHRRQRDLPIPAGALDEISYLFLIRTLPLEVGHTYRFDRYFEEEGNPVIVQVLRRERVRVRAGTFETIVVRPIIQSDGMFGEDGEAEVYISDDDRRLIVQLKSKMRVGSLDMYLRDHESGARADSDR